MLYANVLSQKVYIQTDLPAMLSSAKRTAKFQDQNTVF